MNLWVKKKIKKYLRKLNIETSEFKHFPPEVKALLRQRTAPDELASFLSALKAKGNPEWFENKVQITSKELFQYNNKDLPCKLKEDYNPGDDWLNHPSYYPLYFNLFKSHSKGKKDVNFLEIGVRSGYMAAVFAKALMQVRSNYVGIDPNLYLPNGLDLAAATARIMTEANPDFHYLLINGYSWDEKIMKSLELSPKYDIIHIDGDHTLPGKLHDLELGRGLIANSGIILVDDYEHHSIVADAIARACRLGWFREFAFVPTKRGLAALR